MSLTDLTIEEIHTGLKEKKFSALEITRGFLDIIQKKEKTLNSFLLITEELAIKTAKTIDKQIAEKKEIGILAGVPCAIKDNIMVKDLRCTAGSKILENYIAPYDATCVKKLKEQGAVILGKTNLDEFAMGSSTENSAFKITRNPYDLSRVPGGSSGGSAAAVAAGEACFALGSDTGGSIRQPASFCGVVGLKPTYGAVSRYGLIAYASSLDQVGPLTRTVRDAQLVFNAIKGRDEKDSTSHKPPSSSKTKPQKNFRIGLPKEYFIKGVTQQVERTIKKTIEKLKEEGNDIKEISLPHSQYALACYYLIAPCEASANLARFDGIRYGYSNQNPQSLNEVYLKNRGEGFGSEVKRRIMLGTYALSAGYYDAYYLKAQKVRTLIRQDFENCFKEVDVILTPTSPFPAFKIGERIDDPLKMYLADIFTVAASLAGLPAISVPGPIEKQELPVGIQLITSTFKEDLLFSLGKEIEKIKKTET